VASGVDNFIEGYIKELQSRPDLVMPAFKAVMQSYLSGSSGVSLPSGGIAGDLLKKNSGVAGDASFVTIAPIDIGAADASHTHIHSHAIADTTGLQTALDGKAALSSVPLSFRKKKTADQTRTSSTVLTDITDLTFAISANEEWDIDAILVYDANITADIQFAVTAPAGATLVNASVSGYGTGITGGSYNATNKHEPITALATGVPVGGNNAGFLTPVLLRGTVVNGGTAGNITLQMAQNVSDAVGSIVKANSMLWGVRST
jgi:hypothetical protein